MLETRMGWINSGSAEKLEGTFLNMKHKSITNYKLNEAIMHNILKVNR